MNTFAIIAIATAAIGGILYYFYKRGESLRYFRITPDNSETIEGELKLADIVAFLRLQKIDASIHVPFVANLNDLRVKSIVRGVTKSGYEAIFVGVYCSKNDNIDIYKAFFAKSLDEKLKDILGNETLVVLS